MSGELFSERVISLPRLDAASAAALGEALRSEASHLKKLPAPIAGALKLVGTALTDLHGALRGRLSVATPTPSAKKAADLNVDTAIAALYDWLCALARLPEGVPEGDQAREWINELFPDGVGFVKLSYAKEWAEVETRLSQIKAKGYDKAMQEVGGRPFLVFLNKSHKAYGEALGITAPRPEAEVKETAVLRDALQAQLQAIRFYVLRIVSHVDPDDSETAALAARLLRPLTEWKSRPPTSPTPPEPEPADKPKP